jgi:hypothetical protein
MATQTKPILTRLDPAIQSLLTRLRRRIRAYVWADGLAVTTVVLAAGFWLSLAIDWLFELPWPLRVVMLAAVVAVLCYTAFRLLVVRLLVRLENRNMALLVERRFGQFHDGLLTAVELAGRPEHAAEFNADMLAHTRHAAQVRAAEVDVSQIFNTSPLVRRISLAMTLVASVIVFALAAPDAMGVWARRNLLFSEELWPRLTHLLVEGFGEDGRIKIARGADWTLEVKADASLGREIPEVVEVRYTTTDGARGRENMSREGLILPGQAPYQNYAHTFKSVLAPLTFYVAGGDDRRGPYYLDVVESPTISRMVLHCEYPPYMRRSPRDVPVAGLVQLPRGTEITIQAQANKPLVAVRIEEVGDESTSVAHRLDIAEEQGAPAQTFRYGLPRLDGDLTLLFTLLDADGIRSLEAVRLAISAVADEPPKVNVQLRGIGTAVTPSARLPAGGEVSDDYGVAKVWFEFRADDGAPRQQPFSTAAAGQEKLSVADALEVRELALQPKQKLHVAAQAADGCALEGGPNVGTSQRYVLDVVTPEQLRSMLEARELMLRRRFETIIEEFTDTRNLLAAVFAPIAKPSNEGNDAAPTPDAGGVPGEPESLRQLRRDQGQHSRVVQNVERAKHETRDVAEAFDAIREEMINNRVDTEELKIRLKEGVADPLKRIVAAEFPKLETQLKKLAAQLAASELGEPTQAAAVAQMDAILVEMRGVLDRMLELETFNEVLDMLRSIIEEQEKVNAETKQKQKEKLKELVE